MSYTVGTQLRLMGTFKDINGSLVDPTSVTLYVRNPSGDLETITGVIRQSIGVYYFDYTFTVGGMYRYRMAGSGAVVAAEEGSVPIKKSEVI